MKTRAWVYAVEHPQTLRPKNLKSVAMATVVTGYPQNLISSRSSWVKHPLKIWLKSVQGLVCGTPTNLKCQAYIFHCWYHGEITFLNGPENSYL